MRSITTGAGDLHQRGVGGPLEPGLRIRLPDIPYRAIIGDIGAAVGPNRTLVGRLNPRTPSGKAFSKALLVRETLQVQRERLTRSSRKARASAGLPS